MTMLGKHHTIEVRKIMSEKRIGKHLSEETKQKISKLFKGKKRKPLTEEHKNNIRLGKLGKPNRRLDYRHSKETIKKLIKSHTGKLGEKGSHWMGDKVGYSGIHTWVRKNKIKPKVCEECYEEKRLEIASISKEHKRDINNYKWLCYKCHSKLDFPDGLKGINLK